MSIDLEVVLAQHLSCLLQAQGFLVRQTPIDLSSCMDSASWHSEALTFVSFYDLLGLGSVLTGDEGIEIIQSLCTEHHVLFRQPHAIFNCPVIVAVHVDSTNTLILDAYTCNANTTIEGVSEDWWHPLGICRIWNEAQSRYEWIHADIEAGHEVTRYHSYLDCFGKYLGIKVGAQQVHYRHHILVTSLSCEQLETLDMPSLPSCSLLYREMLEPTLSLLFR